MFYNPGSIAQEKRNELKNLLDFLHNKHVIEGVGIAEATWDFQGFSQDEVKVSRIKYALNYLLEYDENHIKRIFNDVEKTVCPEHSIVSNGKRVFGDLADNSEINYLMLPTITVFLKFYKLLGGNTNHIKEGLLECEERRKIYTELVKFIDREMHFLPVYELWCITQVLFNDDENREKILELLKFKGKDSKISGIRNKVWNAGWDIFFMRILSESTRMYISGETLKSWNAYNPVLITRDKNLYEVGLESMCGGGAGIRFIDGQEEVGLDFEFPTISDEDYEFISDMIWGLDQTKRERVS